MIFSKIENGIIVNKVSASSQPEGYVLDPSNSHIGERRDFFDDNWIRKPLSTLVSEKLIEIPEGYKIVDNAFVEMTEAEKITTGILKPTDREKIEDGKIILKTPKELFDDSVISAKEYNGYIVNCRTAEYATKSDPIFWDYQEGKATKEEWLLAKSKIRETFKKVEDPEK